MKTAIEIISERISGAIEKATGQNIPAIVTPATDPKFGDYQSNNALALAKQLKANPRQLAEKIIANLQIDDICEKPEIAGAGFINLRLKPEFIAKNLLDINAGDNLGIEKTKKTETVVVDFSGPNIAKQMHVGHLRSTIIGDCICRILELAGHKVIRQNHIGNWGTNLGMVILDLWHICMAERLDKNNPYYHRELIELNTHVKDKQNLEIICRRIKEQHEKDWREDSDKELGDGEKVFYHFLKNLIKSTPNDIWQKMLLAYQFVNILEESAKGMGLTIPTRQEPFIIKYESLSRHITAMLQDIDNPRNEQEKDAWELITKISLEHGETIYDMLNAKITNKHFNYQVVRGESFYKDMLSDVVNDLKKIGIAVESDGAICVFPEGFKTKEGNPLPFIIQKSDGAYLYATTDLAALRYRINELNADRIIYVTDARQKLHFEMLFAVVKMADWAKNTRLQHITFGSVLGEDGKPLKTRSGENVKLEDLLDEAVKRAKAVVEEKNPELPEGEKEKIAQAVGIGAVKYADFSNNRTSDYIFSFDKMLAMDGNTAPYMQYAYARVKSIGRKGQEKGINVDKELKSVKEVYLNESAELELAKQLIRYSEAFNSAVSDLRPNFLTGYLYELAQKFSVFYNACPVLDAPPKIRPTRLLLCELTARTIRHGLENLLGIKVVKQM
jgi:arginyl-tRNA synthetase